MKTIQGIINHLKPGSAARKTLSTVMDDLAKSLERSVTVGVNVATGGSSSGTSYTGPAAATSAAIASYVNTAAFGWTPAGGGQSLSPGAAANTNVPAMVWSPAGGGRMVPAGTRAYADGGWVPGMGPMPAVVHGGEYVLSKDMLSGRDDVPESVRRAISSGGTSITVNAQTNADPYEISREIAWALKVGV